jgi:DNA repair exonuclease SbcCD ATPase subunit
MKVRIPNPRNGCHEHERYAELCALATSGELTCEESRELAEHLDGCVECQQALADYRRLVRETIPAWAEERALLEMPSEGWSPERTKANIFARLDSGAEERRGAEGKPAVVAIPGGGWTTPMRYVVLAAIALLVPFGAYLVRSRSHEPPAQRGLGNGSVEILNTKLANLARERDELERAVESRTQALDRLNFKIAEQSREIEKLKKVTQQFEAGKSETANQVSSLQSENGALKADRDSVTKRLEEAQASLASLQGDVGRLQAQRVEDLLKTASMQEEINDLSAQVAAHKTAASDQQKLLASDRDIRELMGARDLYIADVYDVDQNGHNRKAFGRVFYTKNKSLVFYAFDLDKAGLKNAKAFQAWGEKTGDKEKPANLGIFYMDNETNRRWVLKFDNPEVMQQIDAVFVTVEPTGGSEKPSGKQLLYAYLRTTPNHP